MRKIVLLAAVWLLGSSNQAIADAVATHDNLYHQAEHWLGVASSYSPGLDTFLVAAQDSAAGDTSRYELSFTIARDVFFSLQNGKCVFDFPEGFALASLRNVEVAASRRCFQYRVTYYDVQDTRVTIGLERIDPWGSPEKDGEGTENAGSDMALSLELPVRVIVRLDAVTNATVAGPYTIEGRLIDRRGAIVAGPTVSRLFTIVPGPVVVLRVAPAADTTVRAGDTLRLHAGGEDRFGNHIPAVPVTWSLEPGSDSIGLISDTFLLVRRVGHARLIAQGANLTGRSGLISVIPGELAVIRLTVAPDQFVGHPLRGQAMIELYDAFDNSKTDLDLFSSPLVLSVTPGLSWSSPPRLDPDTLSNPDLLVDGAIDLTRVPVVYFGKSNRVRVTAAASGVVSNDELVSFNQYDVAGVLNQDGSRLTRIEVGSDTAILVLVENRGSLTAESPAYARIRFGSDDAMTEIPFTPKPVGAVDSIVVPLPDTIPAGSELSIRVSVQAEFEVADDTISTTDVEWLYVEVVRLLNLQIVAAEVLAPNAPRVNTGQPFQIAATVANLSVSDVGPVRLRLTTTGQSIFDSLAEVPVIPAGDTVDVVFDVTAAAEPNSGELFRVDVASNDLPGMPPVSNLALVVVERPARLGFEYRLVGPDNGVVWVGQEFALLVTLRNAGDAPITDGTFELTTGGVDFGLPDPFTGSISLDDPVTIMFQAPGFGTNALISLSLIDFPFDRNYDAPAAVLDTSFSIALQVRSHPGVLYVEPQLTGPNLVVPAESRQLFRLIMTNAEPASGWNMELEHIILRFSRLDGSPLDAASVLDPARSAFVHDGVKVSTSSVDLGRLMLTFDGFVLAPAETQVLGFVAEILASVPRSFVLTLEPSDIRATFIDGPIAGQPVVISSPYGDRPLISQPYQTRGKGLEDSFVIENNPFSPLDGPVRFVYELSRPSSVEFRVLTLSGEEVFSTAFQQGTVGAKEGENEIVWDGRNNSGETIMNGVYVAIIEVARTGERATMKVAVVK